MKKLLIALLLLSCGSAFAQYPVANHTPHYPHISDMSAMYGAVSLELAGNRNGICTWVSNHFDYVVDYDANGGPVCVNTNGQVYHLLYIESSDVTFISGQTTVYGIQTLAASHSWVMEQMFIHQSQDYSTGPGVQNWSQMDKFDNFDSANGVLTSVSGVFTDVSTQQLLRRVEHDRFRHALCGLSGSLRSDEFRDRHGSRGRLCDVAILEWFFVGNPDAAHGWDLRAYGDRAGLLLSAFRLGADLGKQLQQQILGTCSGERAIDKPCLYNCKGRHLAHERQAIADGRRGKRLVLATRRTELRASSIAGRLLYNANPPAGQTAHFLYQARSVNFANDYFFLNPNDSQGGTLTVAVLLESYLSGTPEGVMFDDAPNWPLDSRLANIIELSTDGAWVTAKNAVFDKIRTDWHASYGAHFLVGGNAQTHVNVCYHLDWCYAESVTYTPYAPQPEPANSFTAGQGPTFYDDMLTANNAGNVPASEMCYDWPDGGSNSFLSIYNTANHYWDRGQRGPITCLAQHYLAGNPNTGFTYHDQGAFNYFLTDEAYTYGPATTTTSTITGGMAPGTITIASATGCGPFDYNGYGYLRVGTTALGDTFYGTLSGTTFTTSGTAVQSYSSGNEAHCIKTIHQFTGAAPPASNVYFWATWFPAMGTDVGIPNTSGLSGGARVMPWKTGASPDCISGLVCTGGAQTELR